MRNRFATPKPLKIRLAMEYCNVMGAGKSSRVHRQYKTKYQIRELEGVRAGPQEPQRRHDLAERGGDRRVDSTEERCPWRPATVLEPRDPDHTTLSRHQFLSKSRSEQKLHTHRAG